ncbi:alkylated DNA repair protein alkB like protein 4 [Angomonas deanei]|nr:alkylated DNA repair protein alkB like protein 4 [Angomonas deanei]EPY42801.1 alkylated DNA repair protein alkB like protein 4 [Angomonas deanei]|eukprot:EPY40079.1 alkylated DNA repair protein alkB like protein 4 [Angomonas deanei]
MEEKACTCTGIRFCALCADSARVREVFENKELLRSADAVIANQSQKDRSSSYSFALLNKSKYALCAECGATFKLRDHPFRACAEHAGKEQEPKRIGGLHVMENIVTPDMEQSLLDFFDNTPEPFGGWKVSQSGRRKQDYGPKRNFKKKKVKPSDIPHMPLVFKKLFADVSQAVSGPTGKPFDTVEVSVLEYTTERMSNFDPHVDDTWLWGDRIVGLNLLEDCIMTFVDAEGDALDVCLPRRCLFIMSGESRYTWMHGIRPESILNRRISMTMRELSDELLSDTEAATMIKEAAHSFI